MNDEQRRMLPGLIVSAVSVLVSAAALVLAIIANVR